MPPDAMDN
jgi:hypothetical protein